MTCEQDLRTDLTTCQNECNEPDACDQAICNADCELFYEEDVFDCVDNAGCTENSTFRECRAECHAEHVTCLEDEACDVACGSERTICLSACES